MNIEKLHYHNHAESRCDLFSILMLFSTLCSAVIYLVYVTHFTNEDPSVMDKTFLISIAIIVVGVILIEVMRHRYDAKVSQEKNDYENKLALVPVKTLTKAATSPELDETTRKVIINYLNDRRPGWSLNEESYY